VEEAEMKEKAPPEGEEEPPEVPPEAEVARPEGEVEERPVMEPPPVEEPEMKEEVPPEGEEEPLKVPPEAEVVRPEGEVEERPVMEPPPVEEPETEKEYPPLKAEEAKPKLEEESVKVPPLQREAAGPQEEQEPTLEEVEVPLKEEGGEIAPSVQEGPSALGLEEGIERLESEFEGIETPTLAEIYCKQGLLDKAMEVYNRLLEKDPQNEEYKAKVEEIREQMEESKG